MTSDELSDHYWFIATMRDIGFTLEELDLPRMPMTEEEIAAWVKADPRDLARKRRINEGRRQSLMDAIERAWT